MSGYRQWHGDELAQAEAMRRGGASYEDIGKRVGRTAESVRTALRDRRLGVRLPSGNVTNGQRPEADSVRSQIANRPVIPEPASFTKEQPVEANTHNARVRPRGFSVERILVLPDSHFPFVDQRAWAVAMKAGRAFRPDRIVHLGDLWDFYAISFHPKSPDRKSNLEAEIKSGCEALDEMASLGASRLDICLGNHEYRWDRYLTQNAPELFNMLRFDDVVRFKERGWHVTPYRKHLTVGKMHFTHEVGYCGKQAHTQSRQEFEGNVVIGHTHGFASEIKGNLLNSPHAGIQLGWLGDREAIDYAHQRRAASWVHAFGVAYHEPGGNVHVFPTPIVQGRAIVEGQLIDADPARRMAA